MHVLPPNEWVALYEPGVIRRECGQLDDYVVLTSPSAWRAVRDQFEHEPKGIEHVTSQEEPYNDALVEKLPRSPVVLGVGGGLAIDGAKWVAHRTGATLILIPTIVSTGAIFQAAFPARRDGVLTIKADIASPKVVLFDTDVIRAAPPHLNAAGMAECVCWLALVAAWRWGCDRGRGKTPWNQSAADEILDAVRQRVPKYVADRDADGRPGLDAIRTCAEWNRERYDTWLWRKPVVQSIDHPLDSTYYWLHRKTLLHAECVALGTLISTWLCGSGFDESLAMLKACGTRYLPRDIGCTWPQVRTALEKIPEHHRLQGGGETIVDDRPMDDAAFSSMVKRIEE